MKLISHRGNLHGPNSCKENHPDSILSALEAGFDCEVDVYKIQDKFYLGHDWPEHLVEKEFLNNPKLWIHCKSLSTLTALLDLNTNVFYHQNDPYTLTSKNIIWTYPGWPTNGNCVIVDQEGKFDYDCYGVCSDWVGDCVYLDDKK
jgi:hypothetical protein